MQRNFDPALHVRRKSSNDGVGSLQRPRDIESPEKSEQACRRRVDALRFRVILAAPDNATVRAQERLPDRTARASDENREVQNGAAPSWDPRSGCSTLPRLSPTLKLRRQRGAPKTARIRTEQPANFDQGVSSRRPASSTRTVRYERAMIVWSGLASSPGGGRSGSRSSSMAAKRRSASARVKVAAS